MSRTESDVGITEYISTHKGFRGIIKARFQDFIVNEISAEGKIVRFDRFTLENSPEVVEHKPEFKNVLSQEDKNKLSVLLSSAKTDEYVMLNAREDKQSRTDIHRSVRDIYPELESATVTDKDGKVEIKVTKFIGNNRRTQNNNRNKYCKFVLYKENIDTMMAINKISKTLRINNIKGFQFAGTKDKRAITVQEITAPLSYERLKGMTKLDSNVCLGNFSYCNQPLHLGDLTGNHFTVVVRNIDGDKNEVSTGVESFKTIGFINYYGMQRFGTTAVPTQSIGIEILKNNWKKVSDLLLNVDNSISNDLNNALKKYAETGEAKDALELISNKNGIEACFLRGIAKFGKSQLIQAFGLIPRNIRLIYLHSYQSLVWNKMASLRISKFGLKPVVGDLVYKTVYNNKISDECEPPEKKHKEEEYRSRRRSIRDVVSLKQEEVDLFSIADIVLPLPGHYVTYPEYNGDNLYKQIMEVDEIDPKTGMVHKVEEYSMPGAYRNIVVKPYDVSFEEVSYNSCKENLVLTDKDVLKKTSILNDKENGKFRALKMEFSLPTSAYATVALREVLKSDLSSTAQQQLTNEHVKQCKEEEDKQTHKSA